MKLDVGGEGDGDVDADLFGGAEIFEFLDRGRAALLGDHSLLGNNIGTGGYKQNEDPRKKAFF